MNFELKYRPSSGHCTRSRTHSCSWTVASRFLPWPDNKHSQKTEFRLTENIDILLNVTPYHISYYIYHITYHISYHIYHIYHITHIYIYMYIYIISHVISYHIISRDTLEVLSPAELRNRFLVHPASYSMDSGGTFNGVKRPEYEKWPLTCVLCRVSK
jgi:hypothetical protein